MPSRAVSGSESRFIGGTPPPGQERASHLAATDKKGNVDPAASLRTLAFRPDGTLRPIAEVRGALEALSADDVARLEYFGRFQWDLWARPKQREPGGSWRWWFCCCGRGWGKTRLGAEITNKRVRRLGELQKLDKKPRRIGLVGRDATHVREEMIEGPDGILARSPTWFRPEYEPSKKRVTWPNGVVGRTFTADEPDSLRGPNLYWMWLDEPGSWRYSRAFHEGANLCLRKPGAQGVITTTPKRVALIKDFLLGQEDPVTHKRPGKPPADFVLTFGSTYENADNLDGAFLASLLAQYEGTATGRQELHGELLEDIAGALWKYDGISQVREHPQLLVVAVAVDPTRAEAGQGDECGIVVGGLGIDGHAYVLDDRTLRGSPDTWAKAAVRAYHDWRADHLTWETNFAKDLVPRVIGAADPNIRLKEVTATRGKILRAEPVAALYEQGRVHHVLHAPGADGHEPVNHLSRLEDEMCGWSPGQQVKQERSPNRLDALVWLITDLMLTSVHVPIAAPLSVGTRDSNWR